MTGDELRKALIDKDRTQQEFADHIGRNVRTIRRMIARHRDVIPRYVELALRSLPARVLEPASD